MESSHLLQLHLNFESDLTLNWKVETSFAIRLVAAELYIRLAPSLHLRLGMTALSLVSFLT
jgi:hypothetical protein